MADLITQDYLALVLPDATDAQAALFPNFAASASRFFRTMTGRYLARRPAIDELYTVDPNGTIVLNEYPVNQIVSLRTDPTPVIEITNVDSVTNQQARVSLVSNGDTDGGLSVVGLNLWWMASAIQQTFPIAFNPGQTVQALANAVNAVGHGWSATVDDGFALWPTADLRAPQGGLGAMGPRSAELLIHVTDMAFELDAPNGIVCLSASGSDPLDSIKFGPFLSTSFGDVSVYGGSNGVRTVYDAGFAVVPEDVQEACAELVMAGIDRLGRDSTVSGETIGKYSWTGRDLVRWMPPSVREVVERYKDRRV